MAGIVYVVHCIDTEGPLYEAPEVPFTQIKNIYGIEIESTQENLNKLRRGELYLEGKEKEVSNLIDVNKMSVGGNWTELWTNIQEVTSEKFRNLEPDSRGNGWVYSWFCMDHVGFDGENPRKRDSGHHHVFDRYMELVRQSKSRDIVQFHHHPVSHSGNYHECGTAFWGRSTLNDILTRKIIDRAWFPTAFRPGFHTERPDSHWFLEQWIPFDYGNQSSDCINDLQLDLGNARFGNWKNAPKEWKPYHPAYNDYRKRGNCRRWITKCLNMNARIREITQQDVFEAFWLAEMEGKAILAFTDHDYKNMKYDIERMRTLIRNAKNKYPDVQFEYVDAITAMRKYCNLAEESIQLKCEIKESKDNTILIIETIHGIFGNQPYLAIKTKDGKYIWDNLDFVNERTWSYTFDNHSIRYESITHIGIAANNEYGKCEVMNFNVEEKKWIKTILN